MSEPGPKHYFRIESVELTDALESALVGYTGDPAAMRELFRLAHTLKGAARVVHEDVVAELAHAIEDVLAEHRESKAPLTPQEVKELLEALDAVRVAIAAGESPSTASSSGPASEPRRVDLGTLKIDLREMDALAAGVLEAEGHVGALQVSVRELGAVRQSLSTLIDELSIDRRVDLSPRMRAALDEVAARVTDQQRTLATLSDSVAVELRSLATHAAGLRLLDVSTVFPELERAVFDAATATGRSVRFTTRGEQVKIDGHVLGQLRTALLHLARNAVAHGIEDPDERHRAGKALTGAVDVTVERQGGRVAFHIADDGRGIDREAVRRRAIAQGVLAEDARGDFDERELIFHAGVSTAGGVSQLAGRGVGLDIVRSVVERCSGEVRVESRLGGGCTFELIVPVSLSAIRALTVVAAGRRALLPLDALESSRTLKGSEVLWSEDGGSLMHEGGLVPFRALGALLEPTGAIERPAALVIVRVGRRRVALGVDAIRGTRDVIVRPLPDSLGRAPLVAGVAFDAHGDPELVLDPVGLIDSDPRVITVTETTRGGRRPILVIDDSLTTRMLEQSILEGAGYTVELASSAEEALEAAALRPYGLFVVDVEMPGMSGYDFTREVRRRPALKDIPIIMVTSLGSDENQRRGVEAGVSAYIVKGDFDQGRFLRTVEELAT